MSLVCICNSVHVLKKNLFHTPVSMYVLVPKLPACLNSFQYKAVCITITQHIGFNICESVHIPKYIEVTYDSCLILSAIEDTYIAAQ